MLRVLQTLSALLLLGILAPLASYARQKSQEPRIVLDLEKPTLVPRWTTLSKFGESCSSFRPAHGKNGVLDKPVSIAELFGAQITVIRIRRYGPGWKKPEDVRRYVSELLKVQTMEVYDYEPWAEMTYENIGATVEFSDHTEGLLEDSSGHVCFSDHSRSVLWLRFFPIK
jgi:hypothetical protein